MSVTSEKIHLDLARLSFPVLWTPKSFTTGQPPKFQATFLLDPSDKAHAKVIKEIKKEAKRIVIEHFGEKPKGLKKCYGLAKDHDKKKEYDGYEGMFYIATSNERRPTLVDKLRKPLDEVDGPGLLYAGAFVNTVITLWTQDHPVGGKGINANLRIIQFAKNGEAFGSGPASAEDELKDVDIEDDDDGADDDWDDEDDI
jgi:hypothetical protein